MNLHDLFNKEPDYIAPDDVLYDVNYLGTSIAGIPIRGMGPNLWRDIYNGAVEDVPTNQGIGPLAAAISKVLVDAVAAARDTTEPGDIGYPIWEAMVAIGGISTKIWIEQYSETAANIFYPWER